VGKGNICGDVKKPYRRRKRKDEKATGQNA